MNKTCTVQCHMVVLCTVTELICNISLGSTAPLYSLSMEICFFFNYCQQIKFRLILNMDFDKLFVSCYPNGRVPDSDLDVDLEKVSLFG